MAESRSPDNISQNSVSLSPCSVLICLHTYTGSFLLVTIYSFRVKSYSLDSLSGKILIISSLMAF